MEFGDCSHQREPKAMPWGGSTTFEPIKALENLVALLFGHTGTVIAHPRDRLIRHPLQFQAHRRSGRRVLQRILNEVREELYQKIEVAIDQDGRLDRVTSPREPSSADGA